MLLEVNTEVGILCNSLCRRSTKDLKDVLRFVAIQILSSSTFCCVSRFILSLVFLLLTLHLFFIPLYAFLEIICLHSANVIDRKHIAGVLAKVSHASQICFDWVEHILCDICVEKEVLLTVAYSMTSKVREQKNVLSVLLVLV